MAEELVMTKDATPKKAAFMSKPYSKEEKIKKEEEELKNLLDEQKKETSSEKEEEAVEDKEPDSPEEKTFKKRYGDLRKHQQQQKQDYESKIKNLQNQLEEATKKEIQFPKTEEEIESWANKYPDVAAIIETIAMKKANEQSKHLEKRLVEINELQNTATKEKAEAELLRLHPDFQEIRETEEFHDWADSQPNWVQNALYENDNDAKSAARAIDLYKVDKGITEKSKKPVNNKDAARSISTKNAKTKPVEDSSANYFKESDVQKMSAVEYEKNSEAIMEAIRSNKFVYDVSGSAR
jgi:DNA repair exonuclease SbcCD ATPase subunit|tara:strand:+ start:109 stop:993 length:885 start_codon:yes stop_codon:yes gene_type:complete